MGFLLPVVGFPQLIQTKETKKMGEPFRKREFTRESRGDPTGRRRFNWPRNRWTGEKKTEVRRKGIHPEMESKSGEHEGENHNLSRGGRGGNRKRKRLPGKRADCKCAGPTPGRVRKKSLTGQKQWHGCLLTDPGGDRKMAYGTKTGPLSPGTRSGGEKKKRCRRKKKGVSAGAETGGNRKRRTQRVGARTVFPKGNDAHRAGDASCPRGKKKPAKDKRHETHYLKTKRRPKNHHEAKRGRELW